MVPARPTATRVSPAIDAACRSSSRIMPGSLAPPRVRASPTPLPRPRARATAQTRIPRASWPSTRRMPATTSSSAMRCILSDVRPTVGNNGIPDEGGEVTASAVSGVRSGRGAGRAPKLDQVCADAVGVARGGIDGIDPAYVGEHLEVLAEGERVVTHLFECLQPGYRGWRWAVTVARVARSRHVTVCETALLPGPDALAAPPWVPWQDRLQPGDLGVGDILP